MSSAPLLLGCDFSSSPNARKQCVLAWGSLSGQRLVLSELQYFSSHAALLDALRASPAWTGGFDLPFGLPRELVSAMGWPLDWLGCVQHFCALERSEIRARFKAFCDARPAGAKFAHRATDGPAGSSPSMKWVNPPVAFMLHAGMPLLLGCGASLPGLHVGTQPQRVALEAYPGLLAREVLGRRSYKSDETVRQTPERLIARKDLLTAMEQGRHRLGLALKLSHAQHDALVADASGDSLDAVLCLLQAAWAWQRAQAGDERYGLPADMDPLEGWIVGAGS